LYYIYKLYVLLSLRQITYNNKTTTIKKNIKRKKRKKREITIFIFIIYLVFAQY